MKQEWVDYNVFLDWLATEESMNSMEFILSQVEHLDLPIWWEQHMGYVFTTILRLPLGLSSLLHHHTPSCTDMTHAYLLILFHS
jgi:hypothetical protein